MHYCLSSLAVSLSRCVTVPSPRPLRHCRDTGVSILSAVDDIQALLDDHIVKAQTMRGSPYVKPFEAEMRAWEEKLVRMQVSGETATRVVRCGEVIRVG